MEKALSELSEKDLNVKNLITVYWFIWHMLIKEEPYRMAS